MAIAPSRSPARSRLRAAILAGALAAAAVCGGCKRAQPVEDAPIDQATIPFSNADQLRPLNPTQYEVLQLAEVKQAGLTDADCLELIQLARKTGQPFSDGDSIAELLGAGESKDTVLTLARMGELGVYSGQVLAMHLANIPDAIILDAAQRRSAGEASLSGDMIAELLDAGYTQAQVTQLIDKGTTDAQAQQILDYRHRASAKGFVRNGRRRH
jgi:hypothetical protein